jgi:hypothetical protein
MNSVETVAPASMQAPGVCERPEFEVQRLTGASFMQRAPVACSCSVSKRFPVNQLSITTGGRYAPAAESCCEDTALCRSKFASSALRPDVRVDVIA